MQNDKPSTAQGLEPFEAGFKGAIFTMMLLGIFLALTGTQIHRVLTAYLITVAFGFLASFSYFTYRKLKSRAKG